MRFIRRHGLPVLVGLVAILAVVSARLALPAPFERLQSLAFDTLQRLEPWRPVERPVRVIDIDDESLKRIGQWPWSRSVVAAMVRALQDGGAASIAFDAVFSEPDRTSPAGLAKAWQGAFGWQAPPGARLPDYDQDLAAAFARGRVVAGFSLLAEPNGAVPAREGGIATIGEDPAATVRNFRGALPNLPILEAAADGSGSFAITAAHDQVIRTMPLIEAFGGKLVPSLSFEALRVASDEDTIKVRSEHNGGAADAVTGYTARIGPYDVPLSLDGSLILHHGPRPAGSTIAAWRLLDPAARAALAPDLAGRIVLIGTSAVGLADLRATPLNPLEPGVNLHARAIEQIVARHFLNRPAAAAGAEFFGSVILAAGLVAMVTFISLRTAVLAGVLLVALIACGAWAAFARLNLLLDPSLALVTLTVAGVAASFARYLVAERDASRLRSAFTHYLSPDLVEALARNPGQLKLGGEQRDMTFLFTDLEGFTRLTESSDPHLIVTLLNAYLDGLCKIAMDHGGTVDKIVGDALHVMFNAPLDQPDHPARAVRCAIAMDAFGIGFVADRAAEGVTFGITRIGVNTGPAVVGNFGGSRRFDYTAHGDAINTAARLEAANKTLGTRICVAGTTAERVAGMRFLPVGTLMLKGKTKGVDVVVPEGAMPDAAWTLAYTQAFAGLTRGDDDAAATLLALHASHPDHPILALHARRLQAGERSVLMAA